MQNKDTTYNIAIIMVRMEQNYDEIQLQNIIIL